MELTPAFTPRRRCTTANLGSWFESRDKHRFRTTETASNVVIRQRFTDRCFRAKPFCIPNACRGTNQPDHEPEPQSYLTTLASKDAIRLILPDTVNNYF
jgi:hypothetical protein